MALFSLVSMALAPWPSSADGDPERIDVLLIGDSITFGGFYVIGGGASYAAQLPDLLGRDYGVINAGCGGASAPDWIQIDRPVLCYGHGWIEADLFETMVAPHLPAEVATVLLGTNDALGYREPTRTPTEDYADAIDALIDTLVLGGVEHIILMTPSINPTDDVANVWLRAYRDILLETCSNRSAVHCGPDLYTMLHVGLHIPVDNPHPNAAGHELIAERLADSIESLALPVPEPQRPDMPALGALALVRAGSLRFRRWRAATSC